MISRKTGARLKKLKTLKIKRRGKRGGMFEAQTHKLLNSSRPVSSKTKLKSTALSGQTDLLLSRLGIPTHPNPQSSMQFAILSRIKAKQRHIDLLDKLLEDSKEFRKRNDFVNAALLLRQAIELGSLPARAELADFFRTGRRMKPNPNAWDEYYDGQNEHNKAHELVYGQDDPDCKGVLALLYLDYLDNHDCFNWRLPNDPLFRIGSHRQMGEAALPLAQISADAGSKYGICALGRWNMQDARKKADEAKRVEEHMFAKDLQNEDTKKEIMKMRLEVKASQCEGVRLIGIAASPPYNYDQAQFMYAQCYSNGFSCLMDEIEGSARDKEQQSRLLAIKYFKMAAAQGHAIARGYVEGNGW
jgi:TPR repeat protein